MLPACKILSSDFYSSVSHWPVASLVSQLSRGRVRSRNMILAGSLTITALVGLIGFTLVH